MPSPIYTPDNCKFAFQLNWILSISWNQPVREAFWLGDLSAALEADRIRVLKHHFTKPGASQFALSTMPDASPQWIVDRVKGRLQYAVRSRWAAALKRNYHLHSIGSARRAEVERYVETQLDRYGLDEPIRRRFEVIQIKRPGVDLSEVQRTTRGLFIYCLHVVLETDGGWSEMRSQWLCRVGGMILKIGEAREHRLSRAGILSDHLHLVLGCRLDVAPRDVAMCYMNNLAYLYGMTPLYRYSAYLGTIGEYDLGVLGPKP